MLDIEDLVVCIVFVTKKSLKVKHDPGRLEYRFGPLVSPDHRAIGFLRQYRFRVLIGHQISP